MVGFRLGLGPPSVHPDESWQIRWVGIDKGSSGHCCSDANIILLDPEQPDSELFGSALHEALHAELPDHDEMAILRMERNIHRLLAALDFAPAPLELLSEDDS